MFIFKRSIKNDVIYKEPLPGKEPPFYIRVLLVITCSLVSFFHGSNDGQKGVGLIMLILIGIVPMQFALKPDFEIEKTFNNMNHIHEIVMKADTTQLSAAERNNYNKMIKNSSEILALLQNKVKVDEIPEGKRFEVRKDMILITKSCEKLMKGGNFSISANDQLDLTKTIKEAKKITDYAPQWVIVLISLSLGVGTMIGWKRIVKTVGEKIGKQHMSYAQGASAEIVAASTIGLSTWFGLPVSTTHVLSSGIAGTMVAKKGLKNLQPKTVKSILLAWVLTLPITMLMSGGLFLLFRWLF